MDETISLITGTYTPVGPLINNFQTLKNKQAKAKEKQNALESIERLLQDHEVQQELDRNSSLAKRNNLLTWNVVFAQMESYFDSEMSKPKVSDQKKMNLFSLVHSVVKQANATYPYLEMTTVLRFLENAFSNEAHIETLALGLINLVNELLKVDHYTATMSKDHWKKMLGNMLRVHSMRTTASKDLAIDTLSKVIVFASGFPPLLPLLRNEVLEFFVESLGHESGLSTKAKLIEGAVNLCRNNATEFRHALCKFGEDIIPSLISGSSLALEDESGKTALVDLLSLQLKLHHPCNADFNSPGFYAHNRQNWQSIVNDIFMHCYDSIERIVTRKKSGYLQVGKISPELHSLFVKITKQVMNMEVSDDENDPGEGPSSKRQMSTRTFNSIITQAANLQPSEGQIIWLQYIKEVIRSFPDLVEDWPTFMILFQMGLDLLNSHFINHDEIFDYFLMLLQHENYMIEKNIVQERSKTWNQVWNLTVKFAHQIKPTEFDAKVHTFQLMQQLIIYTRPPDIAVLLNMFISGALKADHITLNLLGVFLINCTIPQTRSVIQDLVSTAHNEGPGDKNGTPRTSLIRWLLASNTDRQCVGEIEQEMATILCALSVRKSHILIQQVYTKSLNHMQENNDQTSRNEEFEEILLTSKFVKPTPVHSQHLPLNGCFNEANSDVFVIQQEVVTYLINQLQEELVSVPHSCRNPDEFIRRLRFIQQRTCLVLNVLNIFLKHHLVGDNDFGRWVGKKFEDLCVKLMNEFDNGVALFLTTHPEKFNHIHSVIHMLGCILRSDHLCKDVREFLVAYFPDRLVEFVRKIFRSGLRKYVTGDNARVMSYAEDTFSSKVLKDIKQLEDSSLEALRCLMHYGLANHARSGFFAEILEDLNSVDLFVLHISQFDLCDEFVRSIVPVLQHEKILYNRLFELLQKVCRVYFTNSVCNAKLWNLFAVLTPAVAKESHEDAEAELLRRKLMRLVGGFSTKIMDSNINVCKAAFAMLSILAQNDPVLNWSWFLSKDKNTDAETYTQILITLSASLRSRSHIVRMLTTNTIHEVFLAAFSISHQYKIELIKESIEKRKTLYTTFHENLTTAFNIPEKGLPDDVDEKYNRTSLVLSSLAETVFAYPFEQRRVLFSLLLFVKLKAVDISLTCKAFSNANPLFTKVTTAHISYLIEKWIKMEFKLEEFPVQLLGCNTFAEFCETFKKEITVQLFEHNKMETLNAFTSSIGTTTQKAATECFGTIMGRVSPHLAILKNCEETHSNIPKHVSQANDVHKRLITILDDKNVVERLMLDSLGEVVLHAISLVYSHGVTEAWGCPEIVLPEPEPPYHDEDGVCLGLELLRDIESLSNTELSIIGHLLLSSPKSIHRILLTLVGRIHSAHDHLDKYWRLHQYSFFVKLLLSETQDIFDSMNAFLCQFLVHSYLRFVISEDDERFIQCVLRLALTCFARLVDLCLAEIKVHFRFIISRLVALRLQRPELKDIIHEALQFFLKSKGENFADCIILLDPFPVDATGEDIFQEFRQIHMQKKYGNAHISESNWPLIQELDTCLADVDVSKSAFPKEKLRFLKQLLASRKSELQSLVQELEGKRFMAECNDNVTHKLLRLLVGISLHSKDQEAVLEACRCLGEIGPVDLSVLVLPSFGRKSKITTMISAIPSIIESVVCYLSSDDFETVVSAGKVLQSLLEVTECAKIVSNEISITNKRLFSFLIPFISSNALARSSGKVNTQLLETKLRLDCFKENTDYNTWIIQLTCGLITSLHPEGLASRLVPLCKQKVEFCEDILPFIVFYLLYSGRTDPNVRKLIGSYIQQFLNQFKSVDHGILSSRPAHLANVKKVHSIFHNKLALRIILGIVQFLREHTIPEEMKGKARRTPWDNNFWLELNYLDLAKAAQFCGAYLTSILYSEIHALWYNEANTTPAAIEDFYSQDTTSFPQSRSQAEQIESLLLKAYSAIGEQDGVYGRGYSRLYDFDTNIEYLQQMKKWDRSLSMYDSQSSSHLGRCKSMKEIGLYDTLWTYMQGIDDSAFRGGTDLNLMEIQYECGWRLSKWDLNCNKTTYLIRTCEDKLRGSTMRNKHLFESIQNGLCGDKFSVNESIQSGFKNIIKALRHASLESSTNLYGFLSDMQCLSLVEDYFAQPSISQDSIVRVVDKWKSQDHVGFSDFRYQEPILYLRNVLLNSFRQKHPSFIIDQLYDESIYQLVNKAREAGRIELAEKSSTKFLEHVSKTRKQVEIAKNHCARGEQDVACHLIKRVATKTPEESLNYPSLLLLHGEWLYQTQAERPVVIIDILLKACRIYDTKRTSFERKEIAQAHLTLAKYADLQYQSICNYVKSFMFNEKVNQLQKAKQEQAIPDGVRNAKTEEDIRKSQTILRKQANIDQSELNTTYQEKNRFLLVALCNYLHGLLYSDDHDLLIFRIIGLWLERADIAGDDAATEANKFVVNAKLPSSKFIPVLHQLSARMGVNHVGVNAAIHDILTKCAEEHPYQALPVLLTQSLLHKDKELRGTSRRDEVTVADRVKSAKVLIANLKNVRSLNLLIKKMEEVWEALIELANVKEASNENQTKIMNANVKLIKLKDVQCVHVPIAEVPSTCSPTQMPADFPGIVSFDKKYQLVGGVNSPRRITCMGTNGRKYDLLLKGHDDLRQDALMQQVFGVMNELLHFEPRTKVRRLQVRTYKVIPLSQRSGIIEWCQNTQTFGEYLIGEGRDAGAHVLYRPGDYKPHECRRKMTEVKDCGDNKKKLDVFADIANRFKPIFRHFFFENFKDAGNYFERRLAYTRSVPTSSMVGYILGLGDRHILNILVDKTTAEFIHIDLGVAFEQGRILPTPETIPFRLTRDVVDGMGVAGVEGIFRRSAEMTLEVLRGNSDIILTILEVLLYDPLYIWTLTADRMQKVQPGLPNQAQEAKRGGRRTSLNQSELEPPTIVPKERNNSAARVLLRLKQKLLGIEEGGSSGSSLSVPGHVSLLIQKATDPDLLCRVFPGWQPYL